MTLDEIKTIARNENSRNIHIAIECLCDYIANLEKAVENSNELNQQKGETLKKDIKKKGTQNG